MLETSVPSHKEIWEGEWKQPETVINWVANSSHLESFNNKVLFPLITSQFLKVYNQLLTAKIPPRVNQTNHWMSCDIICKTYGFPKTLLIFMAQAIFGTIDEVITLGLCCCNLFGEVIPSRKNVITFDNSQANRGKR